MRKKAGKRWDASLTRKSQHSSDLLKDNGNNDSVGGHHAISARVFCET
ncbi:MAG: hypothetical protein HYZ72_16095 [Deltaproteobacteria bacterium]|nr:hypothetical protein [Deltaproteobacteria bacterium]